MTWKTETIEGKSFSFKYDTATCSVVIYNMFDACFFNPALYIYPPQTKFGVVYIGITLSVRLSMYLVSATPPKPLIGFL